MKAAYIAIDSADGAGKDFQADLLVKAFAAADIPCQIINEPHATDDGKVLYDMATKGDANRWSAFAEACLWTAARNKANITYTQPALAEGRWVITHRSPLTTLAYQAYGKGMDIDLCRTMQNAAMERAPDFYLILDVAPEVGMARKSIQKGEDNLDRFEREGLPLQERVRNALLKEVSLTGKPYQIIDANADKATVHNAILTAINTRFGTNLQPSL